MSRRSEAPPRGQKHNTRLVRFRKRPTLHPRQVRLLKELERLKAEGKLQPGLKVEVHQAPKPASPPTPAPAPPASAPRDMTSSFRNFGEFLKSLPPGTKLVGFHPPENVQPKVPPASAPPTAGNSPRNFGEFLDSLPPGSKLTSVTFPHRPNPVPSAPGPPPLPGPKLPSSLPPLPQGGRVSSKESEGLDLLTFFPPEA